jgi:hypothetical protein
MTDRPAGTVYRTVPAFDSVDEADHWIHEQSPAPDLAFTRLVREPAPHVEVSFEAVEGGRAVVFPGSAELTGTMTVADALAGSGIDRIEVLGGEPAASEAELDTGDFVRPLWRDGALVLTVMPAAGGRLVPFETRNPTPCCESH